MPGTEMHKDDYQLTHFVVMLYDSETTWAVGIAQLTHHEVPGGGKHFFN